MLSSINHNKAEFRANYAGKGKNDISDQLSTSKDFSSNIILPNGLYFKSHNQRDTEIDDRLWLLFKEGIEAQAKEVNENAEKKQMCEIFEFDENVVLNENIPGISMNFLDQLFYQLKPSSTSEVDNSNDENFTEIDQSEITAVINYNADIDKNKLKGPSSFMKTVRLFINDLHEEAKVVCGIVDKEELVHRRSREAKSSLLSKENNQLTSF